jgi:transcriptional regulator with XRE-family HTH domain
VSKLLGHDLGSYLREQRQSAQLSLRQLADLAGISNPYLSQIERGLKKPSAEILQQLARGLQVSAESLYVKAGILEAGEHGSHAGVSVRIAIAADPRLNDRQRAILVEVYESFVGSTDVGVPATTSAAAVAAEPTTRAPFHEAAASAVAIQEQATTDGAAPKSRSVTRRRKQPAPVTPTAAALTTRRPITPRPKDREPAKE